MYKITIERTEKRTTKHREWVVVEKLEGGTSKMGYAPEMDKELTERTEVYQQVVDDLDLLAVILAVNGSVKA